MVIIISYNKQTWNEYNDSQNVHKNLANGAIISADKLNHMENGISNNDTNKVTDNKDDTEQLNGVRVQPYNKLSDVTNLRNIVLQTDNVISYTAKGGIGESIQDFPIYSGFSSLPSGTQVYYSYDLVVKNADGGVHWFGWGSPWDAFISNKRITKDGINHFQGTTTIPDVNSKQWIHSTIDNSHATYQITNLMIVVGSIPVTHLPAPEDKVTDNKNGSVQVNGSSITPADDSKVVHSKDMRKSASDVAGIEEVNAKQDKIGYTPADDSKVVHTTGDETIDGKKKFDTDPTDGAGNAYAKTVDVNQQLDKKVVDNKDGTEQLNGVKVQPFNKLSDTIGGRNLATSPGDVLVTPVDALGWSQTKIGTVTPEFFKIINRGTTQPITISFEINTPDDPTKTNLFDRIQIDGGAWGSDSVIGSDYFSVLGFKWHEMGNNVWKGTYSLQFAKGSYVIDSSRPKIILLQSAKNITLHNFTVLGNSLCLYWGTQVIDWTPAPEDKVNVTDMRKPASDVAGIEEVNAKQDKIGYTPADDSKVVHNTGTEEIAGQKTFDIAPIDKTTGNPYITKDGVPSLPSDIARTGQANTFSSLQTFSQGVKTLQTGSYSDVNSLVNEGLYYNTNSSIKNGARSITTGYIQVMSGYGKMVRQIMYSDTDGGLIYDRTSQDGGSSWSNWTQIVTWSQVPSNFALTNQSQTFRAAQTFSIAPTITDASRDKGDNQAATMADLKSVENSAWRVANTYEASKYLFNPQVIYRVDSENKKIYLYGGGMAGRSSDTNQFKFLDFSDISKNISIDPSTRFTFANNDSPLISNRGL